MAVTKDTIERLLGKRVHLETSEFHHAVGTLTAWRDKRLVLQVRERELAVAVGAVASLREAGPYEAEYLK